MKFTIFTPSYNRAHTLPRLFDSLKKQTFQDFEWLIVDDGSTDETQKIIEEMQRSEKTFPITYLKTENGGKHRAHNTAVKMAQGELCVCLDSDDAFTPDAVSAAKKVWQECREKSEIKSSCPASSPSNVSESPKTA